MGQSAIFVRAKRSAQTFLRICAPSLLSSYIRRKWDLEPEIALLPALCNPDRVSFDIGANWGQYAGALAQVSSGVIACEPVPELARFLRRSSGPSVRVEQVALSNRIGTSSFVVQEDWGRSSLNPSDSQSGQRNVAARLATLDSIATGPVGFIKVDVEGHEEEVIEGGRQLISRDLPVLLIEIEERHRPGALERLLASLGSSGYSCFFLHDNALHSVAEFSNEKYQDLDALGQRSDCVGSQHKSRYINNFLFIHSSHLADKENHLARLGYPIINSDVLS